MGVSQPKPRVAKQLNLVPPRWDRPLELLEGVDRDQGVGEHRRLARRMSDTLAPHCKAPTHEYRQHVHCRHRGAPGLQRIVNMGTMLDFVW